MLSKINIELNAISNTNYIDICKIIKYNYKIDVPDRKKMVDFRVMLIQYFVNLATKNFLNNLEEIDNGTYSSELLDNDTNQVEEALKKFNNKFIFTNKEIQSAEFTGSSVLKGLLDILIEYYFSNDNGYRNHAKSITSRTILRTAIHEVLGKERVEDIYRLDLEELDDYHKLRIIVDFVSGMTDQYAVKLYQRLSGQQL